MGEMPGKSPPFQVGAENPTPGKRRQGLMGLIFQIRRTQEWRNGGGGERARKLPTGESKVQTQTRVLERSASFDAEIFSPDVPSYPPFPVRSEIGLSRGPRGDGGREKEKNGWQGCDLN